MVTRELAHHYRAYIACLNAQNWRALGQFVADEVEYNDKPVGLAGYRAMLENDFQVIPDLTFNIQLLLVDPPHVASRLAFRCSPTGEFLGLQTHGKTLAFSENVFYEYREGKIARVWSVIDKAAVQAQL
ncbi:ester cyclase [Pseudomonas typographi]|uniref:SnoaL-like domain-containing protein n=1 Tax=Pseudomonas typographi TaxID=2715964 RepID=A0ABR7YXB8_9PSED|nr:ester cyclase [Pseudomonas typographi]MBD1550918.1 SnoaL-like domain-containing protein [Pseudomonas typographi]MBD1585741.1 SnoaL-like domain-containing protein [Pseudomonas typographi]MBD1597815.1 SnoaL-like domain-containing protein [Pseudomonas typographi]